MKKLQELKNKKLEALKAAEAINALDTEDHALTEEETTTFDAHMATVKTVSAAIDRQVILEAELKSCEGIDVSANATVEVSEANIIADPKAGFVDMADFALATVNASKPAGIVDERIAMRMAATGANQATPSEGGFLVPEQFSSAILDGVMGASNSLVGMTNQFTVTGESLTIPALDETSRVDGSRGGGIQAFWTDEADQMSNTKSKFRQTKLEPHTLTVLTYVTDKLLRNAPALGQFLNRAAPDEINFKVGNAIIDGDGVAKPKGILQSGALVTVPKEGSQTNDTIVAANINKMWARMPASSIGQAVWFVNQDVLPQLDGVNIPLTDVAGTATAGGFSVPLFDSARMTIKGRPIIMLEYCKTLGDKGDIILADMSKYITGIQGGSGIRSDVSMHLRFDFNESAFRFLFDIDGQTSNAAPLTPLNGSKTLSPFVTLAAR